MFYFWYNKVPPKLTPLPSSLDNPLFLGDYFQLNCAVLHGDAPYNITWYFNDESIHNIAGVTILMQSKRSSSLNIESVTAEHVGKYSCIGANQAGYTEVSTNLTIRGLWSIFLFKLILIFFLFLFVVVVHKFKAPV